MPVIRARALVVIALLTLCGSCRALRPALVPGVPPNTLPTRISDGEFWRLVSEVSEPEGTFLSDNFVSNEEMFQHVIPALALTTRPGGAYLGVGPDQNFTYIVALRPRVAFIVDIRRQNLLLHLLYKALIELSHDRAEFLSRLFARSPRSEIGSKSSLKTLIAAYRGVPLSDALFRKNLRAVEDRLVRHHHFALTTDDLSRLASVYSAFARSGLDIHYSIPGSPAVRFPTYADLTLQTDAEGEPRGYLATEARFEVLKHLEENNCIIPVVGDFAGQQALRAVGRYLREHGATITAFYMSNVEMYLFQAPRSWASFSANLASLPSDARSTLIRTYNLPLDLRDSQGTVRLATVLDSMTDYARALGEGRVRTYAEVIERSK
jgi:hypothetical protein